MSLASLGWDPTLAFLFDELCDELQRDDLIAGRVVRQDRGLLLVGTERGVVRARPAPSLDAAFVVGDWLALEPRDDQHALIRGLLPRKSLLERKRPGERAAGQAMAANVDVAFWVAPVDRDVSLRGIERALTLLYESGASPVVVLSKADLAEDLAALVLDVERVALGVPVLPWSATDGRGRDEIEAQLGAGRTGALLGPSGAGKSTLVNALLGEERFETGRVRVRDLKGRHTTTHRELVTLAHGGLLVDGPGVRELGLLSDEGMGEAFPDVEALSEGCHFSDCSHEHEPGCAVRRALLEGILDEDRLQSFFKLKKEVAFLERQTSASAQRAQKAKARQLSLAVRRVTRDKGR